MISITINNLPIKVPKNTTILAACEHLGLTIPRFCYHKKLSIAGNCRSCLVEVFKAPKPIVACSTPAMPGMKIFTETPMVKKARESIFEFLLKNHPLDCPVCDQGGECDLQDQAFFFGSGTSRFFYKKRSVEDKAVNPIIKTIMTRCIHCTRCVRFGVDVAGITTLGTTNRGEITEIGTYVNRLFDTELAGNVIDLCPVGALTSKPYAFLARPWELNEVHGIDLTDGLGTPITISHRFGEIKRIGPIQDEQWISDKTRFAFDGCSIENLFFSAQESFMLYLKTNQISKVFGKKSNLSVVLTEDVNLEALFLYLTFFSVKTKNFLSTCTRDDFSQNFGLRRNLSSIAENDCTFMIGTDLRTEAAVANALVRGGQLQSLKTVTFKQGTPSSNPTYPMIQWNLSNQRFQQLGQGSDLVCHKITKSKSPLIILSSSLFNRKDSNCFLELLKFLSKNFKVSRVLNVLSLMSNTSGYASLNIKSFSKAARWRTQVTFLGGLETEDSEKNPVKRDKSVFYYSLPSFPSKILRRGSFLSTELRYQRAKQVPESGSVIMQNNETLNLSNVLTLLSRVEENVKPIEKSLLSNVPLLKGLTGEKEQQGINLYLFKAHRMYFNFLKTSVDDFFRTEALSKSSKTMLICSLNRRRVSSNFFNI